MKSKNKTVETEASVIDYLQTISDDKRRQDCLVIIDIMKKQSGYEPKMWGSAIVGFGSYHYKYESGREGDAPLIGFSNRANAISLYLSSNFEKRDELLSKFGKHKSSKACIYVKKLEDVDQEILNEMVKKSLATKIDERAC